MHVRMLRQYDLNSAAAAELGLSDGRCSYPEQFTSARHFRTFVACLPVTPQDSSFF